MEDDDFIQRKTEARWTIHDYSQEDTVGPIKNILGAGAFGEVYQGFDKYSNQKVAIKQLQNCKSVREDAKKEALGIKKYDGNPNIIKLYDIFEKKATDKNPNTIWLVIEYCNKNNLYEMIGDKSEKNSRKKEVSQAFLKVKPNTEKNEPSYFSRDEILGIIRDILNGLADIHEHGDCHLDLKPENVGVHEENGQYIYKLIDFGFLQESYTFDNIGAGSLFFMSPEMFGFKKNKNYKCDIFSFGCILYEVIFLSSLFSDIVIKGNR